MNWKKICAFALTALFIAGGLVSNGYAVSGILDGLISQTTGAHIVQKVELFSLTNQSRMEQGLSPLALDVWLMRLAQEHAEEMAKRGILGHDLSSGTVQVRMSRAGYKYETARENIAFAKRISYVHSALLKSPGHKANILAADVTRIGIGIAKGDPAIHGNYMFIAEIFASPRADYEPFQIKELVTSRVEKLRQDNLVSMKQDSIFEKMAAGSLNALGDSYTREDLRGLLAKSANELGKVGDSDFSRLDVCVQLLSNPDKLKVPDAVRHGLAEVYGTAVRRIIDKDNHPAFLVLMLAGRTRQPI